MLIRCPAGASNIHGWVFVPQPMLDCVDQLSTPAAAAAAAMCSGLDVTGTTHERSGSTTTVICQTQRDVYEANYIKRKPACYFKSFVTVVHPAKTIERNTTCIDF